MIDNHKISDDCREISSKESPEIAVSEPYLKSLEKKVRDLETLIEVSSIISSTLDFTKLVAIFMEKAKTVMNAEACSLLLYNRETKKLEFEYAVSMERDTSGLLKKTISLNLGEGIAGWVAENLETVIVADASCDDRFFKGVDKIMDFCTTSLVAVPLVGRSGLIGVAEILNPRDRKSFCEYDADLFHALCRQISSAFENAKFYSESLQMEKVRQELEIASVLQKSFLPDSSVFKRGGLSVSAINIPADKVSGDIYDFVEPTEGKVGIFIGDVSGKGISAAMYMAKIISDFRYKARLMEAPDLVVDRLNSGLLNGPMGMFLTAVYLIADTKTGELKIVSAGHPPCLLISGGQVRVLEGHGGPPLGILRYDYSYDEETLYPGDRLILLTDGVFDAKNKAGVRLGFDNIIAFVGTLKEDGPILNKLVDYINNFSSGAEQVDDITLVELCRDV
ncbi:MAG: SpoIIE family protein phosphatase [Nitrospirae bacterium]|nr:SpoIIE family protein phosphatase [Nitrospirota bacterium]